MANAKVVFLHGLHPKIVEAIVSLNPPGFTTIPVDGKIPEDQQIEAVILQLRQQLGRWEDIDLRGTQFNRQRQTVEPLTNRCQRWLETQASRPAARTPQRSHREPGCQTSSCRRHPFVCLRPALGLPVGFLGPA